MSVLALIEAVKAGDSTAVQTLLNSHIDIEQSDEYGWTALNWAAGQGHTAIVQLLLNAGANVEQAGRDNRTAYQIALAAAHVDTALILQQAEQKQGLKTVVHPYCKAYPVEALRKFSEWSELGSADDGIVYLHQDFSVTACLWHDQEVLFRSESPEWEKFCTEQLAFFVPTDLTLAAAFAAHSVQS